MIESSPSFPTVMYNVDGPNISPSEIVIIVPGEGQITVSFILASNWEAPAFPKDYFIGRSHFNEEREIPATPSKYVHARLKCCDYRIAASPQYIFHALGRIEKNTVASSVHFAERKQFQNKIIFDQLVNNDNIRRMISGDHIFSSFQNIRGATALLQYVPATITQFGVYTFFLTCSAAEFHLAKIILVFAHQFGQTLTDEQVNAMDWSTAVNY